jgi:hypothetical protein
LLISDGAFTEVFAQGNLFGTSSGEGRASGQGTATVALDLVFTGGTGFFAGFTGEGTATETITRNSPTTESLTGTYNGTLTSAVPEPSTWAMLLLGFAGLGLLACRQRSKPGIDGDLIWEHQIWIEHRLRVASLAVEEWISGHSSCELD